MSDPFNTTTPGARPGQGGYSTSGTGAEDLRAAARQASERVSQEASATAETLKREGAAAVDAARGRAEDLAQQGVRTGAEQADGIARAVHRAADELEQQSPALARTIHEAAGALDGMARQLRDRSPGELLRGAEDFARRQPLAFFGIAALAGFAVARFAKSSTPDRHVGTYPDRYRGPDSALGGERRYGTTHDTRHDMSTAGTSATGPVGGSIGMTSDAPGVGAPGWVKDQGGTPRPATLASASLGGAAAHNKPATGGAS